GAPGAKPPGAFDGRGFTVTGAMTSLTGASGEDFASILRSLGYRMEKRPKPAEPASAPTQAEPVAAAEPAEASAAEAALAGTADGSAGVAQAVEQLPSAEPAQHRIVLAAPEFVAQPVRSPDIVPEPVVEAVIQAGADAASAPVPEAEAAEPKAAASEPASAAAAEPAPDAPAVAAPAAQQPA